MDPTVRRRRFPERNGMPDEVVSCVMPYINDRTAASLVNRRWHELESLTRKHAKIALLCSATPARVRARFGFLRSLKLKGGRNNAFNLIPDWGPRNAGPWIEQIAVSFVCLNSLHLRTMTVTDPDLELLAKSRGPDLRSLKLDLCDGFSTDGLFHIATSCRNLRTLVLNGSIISRDGEWLHALSLNNTLLEVLHFTGIENFDVKDLKRVITRCKSLISLKIGDCNFGRLVGCLEAAPSLEEFCGSVPGCIPWDRCPDVFFPPRLRSLEMRFLSPSRYLPLLFPNAVMLKKLYLICGGLEIEDYCLLLTKCPNLEVLEAEDAIGDEGLEVVAQSCKRLKRLRIDGFEVVLEKGLMAIAQGCPELEYISVSIRDITNKALEFFGTYSKNLCDFHLHIYDFGTIFEDLPLDNGVRALLRGCERLRKLTLFLLPGGLTDLGMSYIGQYSPNIRRMRLSYVGEYDRGLLEFAKGCPSLEKLEMKSCCFSEKAIAQAAKQLSSLRYFRVWR